MDKSKMKAIRKHVREVDLSNEEIKIYERSPDGRVRSRKPLDYGNEEVEHSKHYYDTERNKENDADQLNKISDLVEDNKDIKTEASQRVRTEVLNELWRLPCKILKDGYWYIKLTDVIKIMGDYNELYENESRS